MGTNTNLNEEAARVRTGKNGRVALHARLDELERVDGRPIPDAGQTAGGKIDEHGRLLTC